MNEGDYEVCRSCGCAVDTPGAKTCGRRVCERVDAVAEEVCRKREEWLRELDESFTSHCIDTMKGAKATCDSEQASSASAPT